MTTYGTKFRELLRDANERLENLEDEASQDLFKAHINLSLAIEKLEEADAILVEVSTIAFERVMK